MEEFLSVVFVIIISFYLLKWVLRLILPFLLKKLVQKVGEKGFGQGFNVTNQQQNYEQSNNEGDVTVTNREKKTSHKSKIDGEYIDFEEVK